MPTIVGLSGTHGTGKSTIINGLKEKGYKVDQTQLSRAAQKALGWEKLSIAQESPENMWQLQEAILGAMYDRDYNIEWQGKVTIVERTPADVWAYTKMWCKRLHINTSIGPAANFRARCNIMMARYLAVLVVPMKNEVKFVEEPNRADLQSRVEVAESIQDFVKYSGVPSYTIKSVGQRILEAEANVIMALAATGEFL